MIKIPTQIKNKKVGVLYGGWSEESEISRKTGQAVLNALKQLSLKTVGIELDQNLPLQLRKHKIDFCFLALHGKWGEDGTVQGLCEILGIPYTGSGVLASAMAMNKAVSKIIFQSQRIPTAPFQILNSSIKPKLSMPLPVVIKPVDGGSAIGTSIIKSKTELKKAVQTALKYSSQALMEKFIPGKEVTAPILNNKVLPLIEIIPKGPFYNYQAKYVKGMSRHILPARVSANTEKKIKQYALQAHTALGCRAYSRVDFIVDPKGQPWILELNTIPGMTETSLFPESAKTAGLSFPELLIEIMKESL